MPPTGVIRHFIPRITRRGNGLSTREYHFAAMKRRRGAALEAVSFERCVMSCATQMFGAQRPGMSRLERDQVRRAADGGRYEERRGGQGCGRTGKVRGWAETT